jgi:polyhydroxybutyrate depolymerase
MRAIVVSVSCCLIVLAACSGGEDGVPSSNDPAPAAEGVDGTDDGAADDDSLNASGSGGEDLAVDELAPGSDDGDTGGDDAEPATPSSGCGAAATVAGGQNTITVDDVERTFLVDLPASYDAARPYPLVFAFHGATTSAAFFRNARYGNLLSAMAAEAIVVHADALGDPTAWNNERDLPFFDAMLAWLEAGLCVNTERVFATGHSSGGFFTNTLGCQRGDVLRAIAPVAGGGPFVFGGAACVGEVAVWLAHGENDETVPFTTGEQSRDRWLDQNGCDAGSSTPASPSECIDYTGCDAGLPVRWCVHQDGHAWPDFAPQGMWQFFESL